MVEKVYYSIGEVAKMFQVNTSLIRFWEKEFDVIQPRKNKKGNRLFTKRDVEYFHTIYHLVKEKGYTLKGARDHIQNNRKKSFDKTAVIRTLEDVKSFLKLVEKRL